MPFSLNDEAVEDNVNENEKGSPDSAFRRQLLLSMLASAGASSTLLSNPATSSAYVDDPTSIPNEVLSPTSTSPSIATSLRGDGNNKLIIPPMDRRSYETLTLDNGLRVILCSDPSSNAAAAAMDVHVGAASDPDLVPGLAHFCEVSFEFIIYMHVHTQTYVHCIIL